MPGFPLIPASVKSYPHACITSVEAVLQACQMLALEPHGHSINGNFPSTVGIYIDFDEIGAAIGLQLVSASDAVRFRDAAAYIMASKRCSGRTQKEVLEMDMGQAFLNGTVTYDPENMRGGTLTVDFDDIACVDDAAEDDWARQLAYHVKFANELGVVLFETHLTPEHFIQAFLEVRDLVSAQMCTCVASATL